MGAHSWLCRRVMFYIPFECRFNSCFRFISVLQLFMLCIQGPRIYSNPTKSAILFPSSG